MSESNFAPAYGGPGWRPRPTALADELGSQWRACGMDTEWHPLRSVLLHRPGRELSETDDDPRGALLLDSLDPGAVQLQHDGLAQAYRSLGVEVHYVEPASTPPPNQLFVADLMAMTPEGAILSRPASSVRAGEERWVARALAELGIPILRSIRGRGTFEGADLMWMGPRLALLAQGLRTNAEGATQVCGILEEMGIRTVQTHVPQGTMHLMGQLRIVDRDLAIGWKGRLPADAVDALEEEGIRVAFLPDETEAKRGFSLNFVVLGPRRILMPGGNPRTMAFYEQLGITCQRVDVDEIGKAAGSIGCLTGILQRDKAEEGEPCGDDAG